MTDRYYFIPGAVYMSKDGTKLIFVTNDGIRDWLVNNDDFPESSSTLSDDIRSGFVDDVMKMPFDE